MVATGKGKCIGDIADGVFRTGKRPDNRTIAATITTMATAMRSFLLSRRLWFSRIFFLYRSGR
jgi:hypothetical protein